MYRKLFFWNRENRMNRSITIRGGELYLKIEKLWLVSPFPLWQIFNFLLKTNYVRRANDGDWQPMSNGKVKMRRHTVTEEGGRGLKYFETESLWASVNNEARISSCRSKSFCIEDFSKCTFVHNHDIDPGSITLFVVILSTVFTTKKAGQTDRYMQIVHGIVILLLIWRRALISSHPWPNLLFISSLENCLCSSLSLTCQFSFADCLHTSWHLVSTLAAELHIYTNIQYFYIIYDFGSFTFHAVFTLWCR